MRFVNTCKMWSGVEPGSCNSENVCSTSLPAAVYVVYYYKSESRVSFIDLVFRSQGVIDRHLINIGLTLWARSTMLPQVGIFTAKFCVLKKNFWD